MLRRELAAALRRYRSDFVLGFNYRDITVTGKWNTPDHRHTGRALLDVIGDAGNRWIFPDAVEAMGRVRQLAMANSPEPTHAVDITGTVDLAVASPAAHAAYLGGLTPPATDARTPAHRLRHADRRAAVMVRNARADCGPASMFSMGDAVIPSRRVSTLTCFVSADRRIRHQRLPLGLQHPRRTGPGTA